MTVTKVLRKGKTAKDKRTGAWGNRFVNQLARAEWQKDNRRSSQNFPLHTCNGKISQSLRRK